MRELLVEEKAKRYDEAINTIRNLVKAGLIYEDAAIQVFPELKETKESEDEEIRENIIATIHLYYGEPLEDEAKEMIAWLEKQGEQKPAWSEQDKEQLDFCCAAIEMSDFSNVDYRTQAVSWLNLLKDRVQPHPKQEWSEEDDGKLKEVLYYIEYVNKTNVTFQRKDLAHLINWLKSLRPQPKQDWSQNDIDMIDWLIRCCEKEHEELCNDKYGHQDIVSDLKRDCRKKWDWLESLKNRVAPQKQWKPSDEQMKGIECAIKTLRHQLNVGDKRLDSLYDDLKKLREG